MSIAVKKNNFRVQIRRQNLTKILKHKKEQYFAQLDVNQALDHYLEHYLDMGIPKICALKFQFIEEEKIFKLLELLKDKKVKISVTRPENIALINKLALTDQTLIMQYFSEVTLFAQKMIFTLTESWKSSSNSKAMEIQNHEDRSQSSQSLQSHPLPSNLQDDIIYLPNCLLQYWASFFSKSLGKNSISMRQYCTILQAFIRWFPQQAVHLHNFSKYSLCYFMRNFFMYEKIFISDGDNNSMYKQVQDLHIKFIICSMPIVLRLLEEGFFCDQLVEIMLFIKDVPLLYKTLLRNIREKQCSKQFFSLLLEGLENENFFINKNQQLQKRYFHSQDLTKQQLHTVEQLSIENLLTKNIPVKIWQCKISILDAINGFLCSDGYQNLLFHSEIETICQKLFKTYIYSTQQGTITNRVQKIICLIFYNILLRIESQHEYQNEQQSCLIIHTEEEQQIQQRLRKYLIAKVGYLSQMISKTECKVYDHVVELVSMLQYMSQFVHRKEFDQEIMIKGRLVGRVCEAIREMEYNEQEAGKIVSVLFDFLDQLHSSDFDFAQIGSEIMELKECRFDEIIDENQQKILKEIMESLQ